MDKNKIIVFSVVGIVFLFIIIYMVNFISKRQDKPQENVSFQLNEIKEKEERTLYTTRVQHADEQFGQPQKKQEDIAEHKFFEEPVQDPVGSEQAPEEKTQTQAPVRTAPQAPKPQKVESEPQPQAQTYRGGFGKQMANTQRQEQTTQPTAPPKVNYIPVVLENDYNFTANQNVVLINQSEFILHGQKVERNSYLYAIVYEEGNAFQLKINSIQNAKGNFISPGQNAFTTFDESYSRGIKFESETAKISKQTTGEGAGEIVSDVLSDVAYGTRGLFSAGARTISRTAQRTAHKQKPNAISLRKGYRLYLTLNENENQ